jgi:pentose-5-phosphate-3-epimerase
MEKQLREAVAAIQRAIDEAVDGFVDEYEIDKLIEARNEVFVIGVRLFGWDRS